MRARESQLSAPRETRLACMPGMKHVCFHAAITVYGTRIDARGRPPCPGFRPGLAMPIVNTLLATPFVFMTDTVKLTLASLPKTIHTGKVSVPCTKPFALPVMFAGPSKTCSASVNCEGKNSNASRILAWLGVRPHGSL